MVKFLKKYIWLWEMIGAALLISLGFVVGFINEVLLIMVGLVFVFLGALRFIPLLKTTEDKLLKWMYGIELLLDIASGVTLIVIGIKGQETDTINKLFGYIIGGVLYLRGFVYLFSTSVRKEESKAVIFFIHIGIITLATFIIAKGGFTLSQLGWVILAVAILCAIFIAVDGVKKYSNYRNEEASIRMTKKVTQEKGKEIEAPTANEIKEEIPVVEDNDKPQDGLNA